MRDVLSQRWVRTEAPTTGRTPSGSTTCRWSFSSAARWPTTSPTCCSTRSSSKPPQQREPRLARTARTGARRRPGQRRARAAGGLLPRLDGDDAAAGDGLRAALRIRHLQADDPGRLAARAAGQLAAPPDPWEVARPQETVEVKLNCSFEMHGGKLATPFPAGPRP